jgi:hypothetical protein
MTWSDPIVDEVRRARDAYAARFDHDLRAIFRDLKEQEKRSGRKLVSYAEEAAEFEPNRALQPTGAAISASPTTTSPEAAPAAEQVLKGIASGN